MKMSLLELVQDILNDLDSDEVNTINDTVEAQQVANIVKTCYFEIVGNRNWPHLKKLIQLDASGDVAKPNYLKLPETVKELIFFKYETQKATDTKIVLTEMKYKEPDDFLRFVSSRNTDNANVDIITDFSGTKLFILNNTAPTYWTSFDDEWMVTDSYDSAVDTTLQKAKTQCQAVVEPAWLPEDDFVPDLPTEAFSSLLEESKSTAFFVLKQMANQKAEQKATRQSRWLSRKAWSAKGGVLYPDYGRKSRR